MGKTIKGLVAGLGTFCMLVNCMTTLGASAEVGTYSLGDLNMDGVVNSADMLLMKRQCLGMVEMTDNRALLGDLDGNGCNSADFLRLKKIMLGLDEAPENTVEVDPMIIKGSRNLGGSELSWSGDLNVSDCIIADIKNPNFSAKAELNGDVNESNALTVASFKNNDLITFRGSDLNKPELIVINLETEHGITIDNGFARGIVSEEKSFCLNLSSGVPIVELNNNGEEKSISMNNYSTTFSSTWGDIVALQTSLGGAKYSYNTMANYTYVALGERLIAFGGNGSLCTEQNSTFDSGFVQFGNYTVSCARLDDGSIILQVTSNYMIEGGDGRMVAAFPVEEQTINSNGELSMNLLNGDVLTVFDHSKEETTTLNIKGSDGIIESCTTSRDFRTVLGLGFGQDNLDATYNLTAFSVLNDGVFEFSSGVTVDDSFPIPFTSPSKVKFKDGVVFEAPYEITGSNSYGGQLYEIEDPTITNYTTLGDWNVELESARRTYQEAEESKTYTFLKGRIESCEGFVGKFERLKDSITVDTPDYQGTLTYRGEISNPVGSIGEVKIFNVDREPIVFGANFSADHKRIGFVMLGAYYCFDYDALK